MERVARKKVLLIVVDAASPWAVRPSIESGKLPTLARLAQSGQWDWAGASIFPTA